MDKTCRMCQIVFQTDTPKKRFCDVCLAIRRADTMDRNNAKSAQRRSLEAKTRREAVTCKGCNGPVEANEYGRIPRYCPDCASNAAKERKRRQYLTSRYGSPENWPESDRRIKGKEQPQCTCKHCGTIFNANGPHTKYCTDCAYTTDIERKSELRVKKSVPSDHVDAVLSLQRQKKELAEQIRAAKRAMYDAYEAQKAKAS